jgi:hypothetical protein
MKNLYYTPPADELFTEVKKKAIELWYEVDTDNDKYGYASEKVSRIENIENIEDNFMYMVAMFDIENQALLAQKLSLEARLAIRERMVEGGTPDYYIVF